MTNDIDEAITAAQGVYRDLGKHGFGDTGGEPFDREQIDTAVTFLRQCRKARRGVVSSCQLQHVVTDWGATVGRAPYVSNGATIIAAHALGFNIVRGSECNFSPSNAAINVDERDIAGIKKRMEVHALLARSK
jgi:hypothetical protein